MNRYVLILAVAISAAATSAFAQSSITISGTVNVMWDGVRASGNTGGDVAGGPASQQSLKSADRVRDGGTSNIRFTVIEDLGDGLSTFVQVESAVIQNSDQRTDALGKFGGSFASGNAAAVWGNRNTGIGLRSKTMGRLLIGVWELHYTEHYSIDSAWLPGNIAWSTLSLTQNLGSGFNVNPAIGTRYSNVIRWDSPVWSGFSLAAGYARPTDGAPPNTGGDPASAPTEGRKNRVWTFAPRYQAGALTVQYSYLQDKDAVTTAVPTFAGQNLNGGVAFPAAWKITGNRLGARYKFANGFGIGVLWDQSKVENNAAALANTISVKRSVWALPLTFDTGNHHFIGTYAKAQDWKGSIGGKAVGAVTPATLGLANIGSCTAASGCLGGMNFGSDTGATFVALGYMYNLSQRTNISIGYVKTSNDKLVRYDHYLNTSGNTAVGADPTSVSIGLRHAF